MKTTTSLSPFHFCPLAFLFQAKRRPASRLPPLVGPQCPHPDGGKFESLRLRCCWPGDAKGPCLSERVCLPGWGQGVVALEWGSSLGVGGVRGRGTAAQPSARKLLPLKLPGGREACPLPSFLPPSLLLPAPSPMSHSPLAYPPRPAFTLPPAASLSLSPRTAQE